MAPHQPKIPRIRRPRNRRKYEIQKPCVGEIQTSEALIALIQAALDSYGNSLTEWAGGALQSDIHSGPGPIPYTFHNTLSKGVFSTVWLEPIRYFTQAWRFRTDSTADIAISISIERRGPLADAEAGIQKSGSDLTPRGVEVLQGIREPHDGKMGGPGVSSGLRGGAFGTVAPGREWSDLPTGK